MFPRSRSPIQRPSLKDAKKLKNALPDLVVSVRVPLDENAVKRVSKLATSGAEVIHLYADGKGRGLEKTKSRLCDHPHEGSAL